MDIYILIQCKNGEYALFVW